SYLICFPRYQSPSKKKAAAPARPRSRGKAGAGSKYTPLQLQFLEIKAKNSDTVLYGSFIWLCSLRYRWSSRVSALQICRVRIQVSVLWRGRRGSQAENPVVAERERERESRIS